MDDAFKGVCKELLSGLIDSSVEPCFDAVLIDEAQDLPPEFLQLAYQFTHLPKRLVWAYDELQSLSESALMPAADVFGEDTEGNPRITLVNTTGEPSKILSYQCVIEIRHGH